MIPEGRRQDEFYNCPSFLLLECFQTMAEGNRTQAEPIGFSELRRQSVGLGRIRLGKFEGQTTRGENSG